MLNKDLASTIFDTVVVGGGPAGMAAALASKNAGAKDVLIVEREPKLGGILDWFSPKTYSVKFMVGGKEYKPSNADDYKKVAKGNSQLIIGHIEVKSLTQAINDAIALYLKEIKRRKYAEGMMEAAKDREFIKRTMECQKEFDGIEEEVEGEW